MSTSSRSNGPEASPTSANQRNWAPTVKDELRSAGFTVESAPEHMTLAQARDMLVELKRQIQALRHDGTVTA